MLKKVFLLTQFGPPHPWTEQYLAHLRSLEQYGWYWKIFTPHPYESGGNVGIVPMTLAEFDYLVRAQTGVEPRNFIGANGLPVKLLSDYYPAFGDIFREYIKDFDFWGHTNWDMVYGRLDHFVSDEALARCDIWSDDCFHINGIFTLYRNQTDVTRVFKSITKLYRDVPDWEIAFMYDGRPLVGFDEVHFDRLVRKYAVQGQLHFGHPPYFAHHSYDRLIQHKPEPNLEIKPDGALIERFEDAHPALVNYAPWQGHFGREIMAFHFIETKRWPRCLETAS